MQKPERTIDPAELGRRILAAIHVAGRHDDDIRVGEAALAQLAEAHGLNPEKSRFESEERHQTFERLRRAIDRAFCDLPKSRRHRPSSLDSDEITALATAACAALGWKM